MRIHRSFMYLLLILLTVSACEKKLPDLSETDARIADTLGIERQMLREMLAKPLYEFSEQEIDAFLPYLQCRIPDFRERIKYLARKSLNQPYVIYLLGEYPAELYDDDPLFRLEESDCVVFVEHILSMALSHDWPSFFALLQRIRYKDGIIAYTTRNHYGEYDWPVNNTWLAENISEQLAGDRVGIDTMWVDKTKLFKRNNIPYALPEDSLIWNYVPIEIMPELFDQLCTGDIVNVVRGYKHNQWVGHYGFVMVDEDGTVYFLHSTAPRVIEQNFPELVQRILLSNAEKAEINLEIEAINAKIKEQNELFPDELQALRSPLTYTLGYSFLRPYDEPLKNLLKDGEELRLQVLPVLPEAVRVSKRDSILCALKN